MRGHYARVLDAWTWCDWALSDSPAFFVFLDQFQLSLFLSLVDSPGLLLSNWNLRFLVMCITCTHKLGPIIRTLHYWQLSIHAWVHSHVKSGWQLGWGTAVMVIVRWCYINMTACFFYRFRQRWFQSLLWYWKCWSSRWCKLKGAAWWYYCFLVHDDNIIFACSAFRVLLVR
jgi:hypothetical protein